MSNTINLKPKIATGLEANLSNAGTRLGELKFTTDTHNLYCGDGTTNIKISSDAIIDVSSLPTTDIKENVFYRLQETIESIGGEKITYKRRYRLEGNTLRLNGSTITDTTDGKQYQLPLIDQTVATRWMLEMYISPSETGPLGLFNATPNYYTNPKIVGLWSQIQNDTITTLYYYKNSAWHNVIEPDNNSIDLNVLKKLRIKDGGITYSKINDSIITKSSENVKSFDDASDLKFPTEKYLAKALLSVEVETDNTTITKNTSDELQANAILDVNSLPTTDIKINTVYRITQTIYKYNNQEIYSYIPYKILDTTELVMNANGITEGENVYLWADITDTLINTWLSNDYIETNTDSYDFISYKINSTDSNLYGIGTNLSSEDIYFLYHNPTGNTTDWNLISAPEGSELDIRINGIKLQGNQPDSYYHISKELTEEEYNNLSNEEKNNGTAYYVDAGGDSSNVNETNYNNLTNKPSINGVTLQQGQTANDLDIYTRSQVDAKMSGIFKYKGVVATINDLPSSTSSAGDCYYVTGETSTYAFNGSAWENIGSTVDLTNYQTATDNSLETTSKTIVGGINELNADKVNISSIVDNLTSTATNVPLSANQGKVLQDTKENISNKTTTIDNSSTDTQYPSAKAVYDGFAPISTSKYVSTFKSPNDCIVPFGFHRILNMANERATIEGLFVSQMTDPVDGSSNLFGDLKVRQQCYGGSTAGSATNICIEQIFETYLRGSPTQRKVFFRRGYLANSATDIDINNVEAIKNSLTWMSWYPIEYPNIALTLNQEVVGANSKADLAVSGGIATIRFNNLSFKSAMGSTATLFDSDTRLSILRTNKYQTTSTAGSYVWNVLISTDPTKTILVCSNPNLFAWGATANVGYYGLITIPLGY